MRHDDDRGFVSTGWGGGGLLVAAGAALVIGLAVSAVHAGDPLVPAAPAVAPSAAPDPMTADGQSALSKAFGRKHTPSPLVIPDQTIPLRFSHKLHVDLVKCTECHKDINSSLRAKDRNLPLEDTCLDCHDQAAAERGEATDPPSKCETCHPGFQPKWLPGADFTDTSKVEVHPPAIVFPEPHLKFNHKVHLQKGVTCESCHGDMKRIDLATRDNVLPVMATCIDCHDGKKAPNTCRTCHLTLPDGRIDTDLPGGELEPAGWYFMDAHDDKWLENHRAVATLGENGCAACHTQKECLDCHNGVQKPLKVHPNNWVLTHTIPARRNDPECGSCHRSQSFCVDCHTATRVVDSDTSRYKNDPAARFHPVGWVERFDNPETGRSEPEHGIRGPNHHSFQAQRNVRACASCHTEATCINCHGGGTSVCDDNGNCFLQKAPAAFRVNPHPQSWTRGGDCVRMRNKNERVCYKCHDISAQEMRCDVR